MYFINCVGVFLVPNRYNQPLSHLSHRYQRIFFVEFNQQDNQQNSIISVDKGEITLLHASLSTPCFISTNYYASAIDMTLEQLNKMTLFPLSSKDDIDILLVGTGANSRFLDPKQQVAIQQMGIGIESMSTESACRSFNLLLCDVRRVGLLLL